MAMLRVSNRGITRRSHEQKGVRIRYIENTDNHSLPISIAIGIAHASIQLFRKTYNIYNRRKVEPKSPLSLQLRKLERVFKNLSRSHFNRAMYQCHAAHILLSQCDYHVNKDSFDWDDLYKIYERLRWPSCVIPKPCPPFSFHVFSENGLCLKEIQDPVHFADQTPILFIHDGHHFEFTCDLLHIKKRFCTMCKTLYHCKTHHRCRVSPNKLVWKEDMSSLV